MFEFFVIKECNYYFRIFFSHLKKLKIFPTTLPIRSFISLCLPLHKLEIVSSID